MAASDTVLARACWDRGLPPRRSSSAFACGSAEEVSGTASSLAASCRSSGPAAAASEPACAAAPAPAPPNAAGAEAARFVGTAAAPDPDPAPAADPWADACFFASVAAASAALNWGVFCSMPSTLSSACCSASIARSCRAYASADAASSARSVGPHRLKARFPVAGPSSSSASPADAAGAFVDSLALTNAAAAAAAASAPAPAPAPEREGAEAEFDEAEVADPITASAARCSGSMARRTSKPALCGSLPTVAALTDTPRTMTGGRGAPAPTKMPRSQSAEAAAPLSKAAPAPPAAPPPPEPSIRAR